MLVCQRAIQTVNQGELGSKMLYTHVCWIFRESVGVIYRQNFKDAAKPNFELGWITCMFGTHK